METLYDDYVLEVCQNAKKASKELMKLDIKSKDNILNVVSNEILKNKDYILSENKKDIDNAKKQNQNDSFIERLELNENKIEYMAQTLLSVSNLKDVIDQYDTMTTLENGLVVGKKRVPLGVVCLIFESRPNVLIDSFALCMKTGNTVILRGGKEAIFTTKAMTNIIQNILEQNGFNKYFIQLITNTDRELVPVLTKQNKYIDVVIPRGSNTLIQTVIKNSTVPVIETGVGNCHIFVDKYADINMAIDIILNAKTQRVSVCNAMESLLVDDAIKEAFLPLISKKLAEKNVIMKCCSDSIKYIANGELATDEDFYTEFLDYIVSIKVVEDIDDAINHIDTYGTKHSESIITKDYANSQKFLKEVDASTVYVNASTRFTDGDMFGFGGEIGISTQKLHARGPMGLKELTTYKYIVYGNGQVR